jgi:hypothetical protein
MDMRITPINSACFLTAIFAAAVYYNNPASAEKAGLLPSDRPANCAHIDAAAVKEVLKNLETFNEKAGANYQVVQVEEGYSKGRYIFVNSPETPENLTGGITLDYHDKSEELQRALAILQGVSGCPLSQADSAISSFSAAVDSYDVEVRRDLLRLYKETASEHSPPGVLHGDSASYLAI